MVEQLVINADDVNIPNPDLLVTEDDTPVDNLPSEKQQRLLVSSLYSSLQERTFLAVANVAIYYIYLEPAIVPDVFLSFDVQAPENWWEKQNRCYLVWKFGKCPEVVIEIVSNKVGKELDEKLKIYEKMQVNYYIVYDPNQQLGEKILRVYMLDGSDYIEIAETWLENINLGVTLWTGEFEGRRDSWLRWCYQDGTVLPTGDEIAQQQRQIAQQERQRAQLLAQKLRDLGLDPDAV